MSEEKSSTAIATRQPDGRLTSPAEFRSFLESHREQRYHVLSPAVDIGALPAQWALVPSIVQINPEESAGEVYRDGLFCKGDEVALTKVGLRKLARGGGLSWTTTRLDSGTVQHYWSMQCSTSFRGFDGQLKENSASYEWDLRDGSPRVAGMSPKELNRARLNGMRRCEAGAINAAIREFGIKQKYTKADLAKPFVVFNLVFQPDMSDPQQRAMVTHAALMGASTLYPERALPPIDVNTRTGEIIEDEPAAIDQPTGDRSFGAEPSEPVFHVTDAGQRAAGGYYVRTKETGDEQLLTDSKDVALAAHAAKTVHLELEKRADGRWIVEVRSALPATTEL